MKKKNIYYNDKIITGKTWLGFKKYRDNFVKVKVLGQTIEKGIEHDYVVYLIQLPDGRVEEAYKSQLYS
jgi:hypothetical protein